jgi:hypothetical protein
VNEKEKTNRLIIFKHPIMKLKTFTAIYFFFLIATIVLGENSSLSLSFTANVNGSYDHLSRINIPNLDKNCDTALYWPDTLLIMNMMGLNDHIVSPTSLQVFQNMPNPVGESTFLKIYVPETGYIQLFIMDISGKTIAFLKTELRKGYHKLLFRPGNKQIYLFTAVYKSEKRSIKIVVNAKSTSRECSLSYIGIENSEVIHKSAITSGKFQFSLGDSLKFTGYYNNLISILNDAPTSNKNYSFLFSSIPCLATITINHVTTGGVAPVNKTVTYEIIGNVPGERSKCWITRNLGASTQAYSMSDYTEASAGWYFQFNRKQGYQYINFRIPTSTWIENIIENSDWINTNDPCSIELGTTWRIPTYTEWYNVDTSGVWTSVNSPWGSVLRLHAAGGLVHSDGSLSKRGSGGYYLSSMQYDASDGYQLFLDSGHSFMYRSSKANGFSARCIRD